MPFSAYFPSPVGNAGSGDGPHPFPAGGPEELDFDAPDCDSEEVLEEPARPARSGSGSKRSRAAEVHNLSEKRRRSRINEKMKALQNLIPNSNKTDKASMLDEAIEYLKQLQLQVQMLSMRNGLNLHPLYMPGPLQPFQPSQFHMGFGGDNVPPMNMGPASMLPTNLDSSVRNPYDQSNQHSAPHQSIMLPGVTTIASPGTAFTLDSSQPQNRPFQLPVATEIFTEDTEPRKQLDSARTSRNLQETETKPMAGVPSLYFDGQVSSVEGAHGLRRGDVLPKGPDNEIFIRHLHG